MKTNLKNRLPHWSEIESKKTFRKFNATRSFSPEEEKETKNRHFIFAISAVVVFCLGMVFFRAFDLMVVNGGKNRETSLQNRIRLNAIEAPRGVIFDRNGRVLARNTAVYQKKKDEVWENIPREEALRLRSVSKDGVLVRVKNVREYLYSSAAGHVLGYLTEITKEEREKLTGKKYDLGDKVGRLGLEEQYEKILRGQKGRELIETDALGKTIKKIGEEEPIAGTDLKTTIDADLQALITEHFPLEQRGAVVASVPKTGEVLAVFSSPSFDPNLFTIPQDAKSSQELREVLRNSASPLFNRSIAGVYPPGSTFKIVTSASGLETGKIDPETEIEDTGVISVGPFSFSNWYYTQYGGKEGQVNLVKALKRSNDIYFYKVGEMVGVKNLDEMARKFGLSKQSGIDLPHETEGLMPSENWKKRTIGEGWYLGDTYHLAIGQGFLLTTPLQVNLMTNVIANGGKFCRPYLVSDYGLNKLQNHCADVGLKKETISVIREGLRQVCFSGGTAWPFFDFAVMGQKMDVGCKTGTAEFGDPQNRTHAWFTVFAPYENPRITLTVLVEGAGEGSNVAAPIAKKILEEWLRKN